MYFAQVNKKKESTMKKMFLFILFCAISDSCNGDAARSVFWFWCLPPELEVEILKDLVINTWLDEAIQDIKNYMMLNKNFLYDVLIMHL